MITFPIYGILFFSLFGGSFIRLGAPSYLAMGTELLVLTLLLNSLLMRQFQRGLSLHLWYTLFFMALVTLCSIALNRSGVTPSIFSLRLLFRFYIFYLAFINLNLHDRALISLNTFLAILLLLQLPVVAYKFHLYGISEKTQGTYAAVHSGSMSTILPMSVIFYAAGYYFLYRSQIRFVLTGVGFILFSIVGAKRAVAFLYPIQFLSIYYYIYIKGRGVQLSKKVGMFLFFVTVIFVTPISIFYFNKTLNPERSLGGSVDVEYAFNYAKEYTTRENFEYTWGRTSTTIRVFEKLWESGFAQLFFGIGPGSTTLSLFDSSTEGGRAQSTLNRFKIGYGLTPMNRIAIEYGLFGVIVFSLIVFSLARMCWRYYTCEVDAYWKAFAAGSVGFAFSMFFFFVAYSHSAFWGDTAPVIYFYAMGVVYTRWRRMQVQNQKKTLPSLDNIKCHLN